MDVVRAHTPKDIGFTVMVDSVIEDERLAGDALAVLLYLLSKPPGWIIRPSDIKRRFGYGKERHQRILKDLIEAKYLQREQTRDGRGRIAWKHTIYSLPQDDGFDIYGHRGKRAKRDESGAVWDWDGEVPQS